MHHITFSLSICIYKIQNIPFYFYFVVSLIILPQHFHSGLASEMWKFPQIMDITIKCGQFHDKILLSAMWMSWYHACLHKMGILTIFLLQLCGNFHNMLLHWVPFCNTRISGRYLPLIIVLAEDQSLEPCPYG